MKDVLKCWIAKRGPVLVPATAVISGGTTTVLNVQSMQMSQAGPEIGWWSMLVGGVALTLLAIYLQVVIQGGGLIKNDRINKLLGYLSAAVIITVGLALSAWLVVTIGILNWAIAESCLLVHLMVPSLLIWGVCNHRRRTRMGQHDRTPLP